MGLGLTEQYQSLLSHYLAQGTNGITVAHRHPCKQFKCGNVTVFDISGQQLAIAPESSSYMRLHRSNPQRNLHTFVRGISNRANQWLPKSGGRWRYTRVY